MTWTTIPPQAPTHRHVAYIYRVSETLPRKIVAEVSFTYAGSEFDPDSEDVDVNITENIEALVAFFDNRDGFEIEAYRTEISEDQSHIASDSSTVEP